MLSACCKTLRLSCTKGVFLLILISVFLSVGGLKAAANTRVFAVAESDKSGLEVSLAKDNDRLAIANLREKCRIVGDLLGLSALKADIRCFSIDKCPGRSEEPGCYSVSFRIDQDYSKINMKWCELVGYSNETGKYKKKTTIFDVTVKDYRRNPDIDHIFSIEADLGRLPKGTYRIALTGTTTETRNNNGCGFTFNFDGKKFSRVPEIVQR